MRARAEATRVKDEAARTEQELKKEKALAESRDDALKQRDQVLAQFNEIALAYKGLTGQLQQHASAKERLALGELGDRLTQQVCQRYSPLCSYNRDTWRKQFLHEPASGTWHVVVSSQPPDASEAANRTKTLLQRRFPNLDFDVLATQNADGGNPQLAIVVASGLNDPHLADKVASFARDLGVDKHPYKKKAL